MDKISVVTVTYNCKNDVEKTIKSVLEQDYPSIEYIIIDGASTDGTIDVIKKYADHIDYWISEPDKGIYDAMNKGLEKATGDWIFFLNTGDVFANRDVLQQIPFCECGQELDVCGIVGDIKADCQGRVVVRKKTIPFYRNPKRYKNMGFSHQGVFVRTNMAKALRFDLKYSLCADYNMMVELSKQNYRYIEIDLPICVIQGGVGASEANRDRQMIEEAQICQCDRSLLFYTIYCYRKFKRVAKKILFGKIAL